MRPYREIKSRRLSYCGNARHESVYRTDDGNGGTGRTKKKPCTTLACVCVRVCVYWVCVPCESGLCVCVWRYFKRTVSAVGATVTSLYGSEGVRSVCVRSNSGGDLRPWTSERVTRDGTSETDLGAMA